MDRLELNIEDIVDEEAFLKGLQNWLLLTGATANGIFREDVDPETNEDKGTVQIINNDPVMPGREVKHGNHGLFVWELGGIEEFKPFKRLGKGIATGTTADRGVCAGRGGDRSRPET